MLRWLPENVSTYGGQIDRLFSIIEWITGITFVVVIVLLLLFIVKYRDQGGRRATYTHGNTVLEVIWTIVPAIILIVLFMLSQSLWWSIKGSVPATDFQVQVMAQAVQLGLYLPRPRRRLRHRRRPHAWKMSCMSPSIKSCGCPCGPRT